MQRVTISMSDELAEALDRYMARNGYDNRSEAIRDLARAGIAELSEQAGECVATLSYVYDHDKREIPKRLTNDFHHHHDLSIATLHVHLSTDKCLEVAVLRGDREAVRIFGQGVIAQRGVEYGRLNVFPTGSAPAGGVAEPHRHGHHHHGDD